MSDAYGIHWFRRDLRLAGNPALEWNWREHQGRVLGIFCFDKKFLERPDFSFARFQFFLNSLKVLSTELAAQGSELLFLDVSPDEGFHSVFTKLRELKKDLPRAVSFNRDYEPFARERDARMSSWFAVKGVAVHTERDHLLIEPHEIAKDAHGDEGYQVYTPFQYRWLERFRTSEVQARLENAARGDAYLDGKKTKKPIFKLKWAALLPEVKADVLLAKYDRANQKQVTIKIPEAGSSVALKEVRDFKKRVGEYTLRRDLPGERGTSGFSIYFKNGSLTIAQVILELGLKPYLKKDNTGPAKFLSELIWREFYYHILFRHPRVEHEAFQTKFAHLKWENNEELFEAWKTGQTGYPIVDAGMRQLNQTGWMHNRVRMIVASFLTKDLLIDWKWGERYFMEKLLDGDLAPNNGGWQWAASTGCDPQPYFRIFNPVLQSRKFDPEGKYLRKYVPEIAHLDNDSIHFPPPLDRPNYPQPVVMHEEQRIRALELYKG